MLGLTKTMPDGRRRATGRGVPFTLGEEKLLISLYQSGATDRQIAERLECKPQRIVDKRKHLGLMRGRPFHCAKKSEPTVIRRTCLSCSKDFNAAHRLNFICQHCATRKTHGGW